MNKEEILHGLSFISHVRQVISLQLDNDNVRDAKSLMLVLEVYTDYLYNLIDETDEDK